MKQILIILLLFLSVQTVTGQRKPSEIQTKSSLGIKYYNSKDYEKAMPLLEEVYRLTNSSSYFTYYINCLVQLKRFDEAEKRVERELRKQKAPKPDFFIHWGYILKAQNLINEGEAKYREAIKNTRGSKGQYLLVARSFTNWGEHKYAKETYQKAQKELPNENFHYELARVYMYLRDYPSMMEEYLNLLRKDEKFLSRVQSSLSSALRLDIDNELRDRFRTQTLKRIQSEPEVIGYNRLLIWFFLQEKKFSSALRQVVALDKRTGSEGAQVIQLGKMAVNNRLYADALNAYDYLLDKGPEDPFYKQALAGRIHASYLEYTRLHKTDLERGESLAREFNKTFEILGRGVASLNLIREDAHLLCFYLDRTDEAKQVLEEGLRIPGLKPDQLGLIKTELADVFMFSGDPWEASLLYSQVIEANKKNSLGDRVKLKKAKLAYYLGNFDWAKAQLDVIKGSTSKLTANDAMELSLLIGNNLNLDTTARPLQMFAQADLLFFQNKDQEAILTLDSLSATYPYHSLVDDILYRKAKIQIELGQADSAAVLLEDVIDSYGDDMLADDALFTLAELYNYQLNNKERARDLYKQMLSRHPGSVFIEESRTKYRELLAIYPEKDSESKEGLFMRIMEEQDF